MAKRRNFSAAFKAKACVASERSSSRPCEAIRRWRSWRAGTRFPPNLITKWKRQAGDGMVDVFSGKKGTRDGSHEAEIKDLHAKIGELTVEKGGVARRFALWPRPSAVEPHPYGKGAGGSP